MLNGESFSIVAGHVEQLHVCFTVQSTHHPVLERYFTQHDATSVIRSSLETLYFEKVSPMLNELKIRKYMTPKPRSVQCHVSIAEAAKIMAANNFRHLPVFQGPRLVGMLSERDIALVEAIQTADPSHITVTEAMTPDPYVCSPDDSLLDVALAMIDRHIGAALVQEKNEVVGIYTTVDALRTVVELARRSTSGGA